MGPTSQKLFGWRRQLRQMVEVTELHAPQFVPAVIETPVPERLQKHIEPRVCRDGGDAVCVTEVQIAGVMVRIGRGAEAKTMPRFYFAPATTVAQSIPTDPKID
jgi:hypothetical protein